MAKKSRSKGGSSSGFITNLRKSAGSIAKDTAKDLMPNLSSTIKNNARFIKTTYKDTSSKFRETDLKESFLFKSGNDLIKNAMSDIKTGNINNKERQQKNTEDPFAKLLNFDFDSEDDLSDMFADEKSEGDSPSDLSGLSLDLDADTKNDIKAMANFSQANTKITNRGFAAMTTQLRSISAFQNQNTLKFYEMVEEKLNQLESHMSISSAYYKDLVENTKKAHNEAKRASLESAFDLKGFNIEDYVDIYKENFKGMFEAGSMIGSMMLKPMIADIVNNPLGALGKMGLKSLIPKGVKRSLKDFDETLGILPMLIQGRIPNMKKKGGIWEIFGNLLDLDKNRVTTRKNEFVKGPVPFDGITKRAITHVIPGYLKRILFALTGDQKDNLVYDMNSGKFISEKDSRKSYKERFEKSRRSAIDGNIDSLEKEYVKALKAKKIIKSDEEASSYLDELRESLSGISKKGKTLASDLKASDLSSDKKKAKILKEVIDGMDMKGFAQTNKAMATAYMYYQQELRNASGEDLWSSTFDKTTSVNAKKQKANPIFDNIENMTGKKADSLFKKFVLNKIKNDKLRAGLSWFDEETEDGKNATLDKFNDRVMSAFKGDIEFDKKDFKKNKKSSTNNKKNNTNPSAYLGILQMLGVNASDPSVRKILKGISEGQDPSTFKATVNKLISGAKGGVNFANQGLMQYMTATPEGLALRVKIADGTTVPTTEGPNDPLTVEKNLKTKKKAEDKLNNHSSSSNVVDFGRYADRKKKATGNYTEPNQQLALMEQGQNQLMVSGGDNVTNSFIENPADPSQTILGQMFTDITGGELSKAGITDLVVSNAMNMVMGNKYSPIAMKYAPMLYQGGKEYAKKKNLWQKLGDTKFGQGMGKLFSGSNIFRKKAGEKGKDVGAGLFGIGSDLLGFIGERTGMSPLSLLGVGKTAAGFAGDTIGGLAGGLGDVLAGNKSIKQGAKDLFKGGLSTSKSLLKGAKKGFGNIGKVFKDGGLKEMKDIIFAKRKRIRPDEESTKNNPLLIASNSMSDSVVTAAETLQISSNSMATTIESAVDKISNKIDDFSDAIEVNYRVVDDNENDGGLVDNIIGEVVGESVGGNALSVLGGGNGKKGILSRLLGKGKGLLGKGKGLAGKAFGAFKGAGILGKLGGLVSGGGSALAGLAGGAGSALGGLASGAGSLLAGGGSALAGLAGGAGSALAGLAGGAGSALAGAAPLLAGLTPVLGPALALGAGVFGVGKLFKSWKKKREEKKAAKEQERAMLYDENGNYKTDSEGYSVEKGGLLSRIFRPFGHKPDNKELDKLNGVKAAARFLPGMGLLGLGMSGIASKLASPVYAGEVGPNSKMIGDEDKSIGSWNEYVAGNTFKQIFGAKGFLALLFKGAKSAASGRTAKSLTEFFKKFWTASSTIPTSGGGTGGEASLSTGVGYGEFGGLNGQGVHALSGKYETGDENGGDPGEISDNANDPGGKSYGVVQFAKNTGSLKSYVESLKSTNPDWYNRLSKHDLASSGFDNEWTAIANEDREGFKASQVDYATKIFYEPLKKHFESKGLIDFTKVGTAVESALFSMAMHNGPGASIPRNTLDSTLKAGMTDEQIINAIYDARDAAVDRYSSWDSQLKAAGHSRFKREREDALKILKEDEQRRDSGGKYGYSGSYTSSVGTITANGNATGKFTQPVPGHTTISSPFGLRTHPVTGAKGSMHNGIDIPAPNGTTIVASDSGTVTHAGEQGTYGKLVKISHGNGYETRYAHCSSINVSKGQTVSQGQAIAKVGSTGRSTGNHLHFEIRKDGTATNPTSLIGKSTSGGGAKGGPDTPSIRTNSLINSISDLTGFSNRASKISTLSNVVVDPEYVSNSDSSSSSTYSVKNSQSFRDETRNNIMLKIKDVVETICQNTGKTNEILTNILKTIMDSANSSSDSPLDLDPELASIYRGF